MDLRELVLTLPAARVAEVEKLLALAGASSLCCEDAGDAPLLEPATGTAPLWPTVRLRALFRTDIDRGGVERLLALADFGAGVAWRTWRESDWRRALEQRIEPLPIGRRLLVAPADWNGATNRTLIRLGMGLGFGTGVHPTTALCLDWLECAALESATILDFGCGSGVLAIAALRLGARYAWALDVEPQALRAAQRNAERNGVAASIWIGRPEAAPAIKADVVVANIVAGTLIGSVDWLAERIAPGGRLVLGGILVAQCTDVERAFGRRFEGFEYAERAGWLRVTATAGTDA